MKIVFLNATGQLGGAENVTLDALASLRAERPAWPLHLIAAGEGPLVEKARALGVEALTLSLPDELARLGDAGAGGPAGEVVSRAALALRLCGALPEASRYVRALRRELRRIGAEVIHTNGFKMHVLGAWARPRGSSVVWHVHDYLSNRPFASRLLRASSRRCDAVIANSESVASDFRAVVGASVRVRTIHNAVNLEHFAPEGRALDLDALSGLEPAEPGTVRVGLVATLARWKGHDTFLRALALLPPSLRVRGYVAGDALYQTEGSQYRLAELRNLAERLGVARRVGFTGFVEDAAAAMRALDVVVHASTAPEPFGLVIAEAMACGRAVVASEGGGASEVFSDGVNAFGHSPGDAESLAESITKLACDAELRAAFGRAGRAASVKRFDRARLAAQLIPVYEELRNADFGLRIDEARCDEASRSRSSTTVRQSSPVRQSAIRHPKSAIEESAILRVLHVHSGNMFGGVETLLLTLARERDACGELESSFALCFRGRLRDELSAAGASVSILGEARVSRPLSVWRARRALEELLAEGRFDLIVCHSAWTQSVFGPVLRAARLPLVFWMHAPHPGTHPLERLARRTRPDLVVCNSQFTAQSAHRLYPRARAEVVYCPVSPNVVDPDPHAARAAVRAELDTPADAAVIVQVSRLEDGKGHALHLESLSLLKDVPGWVCWVVGGGARPSDARRLDELKSCAARLGVSDRVRFTGERGDVKRLLAAADIYCQPNTAPDSFGLSFIEALRARLPVVTTPLGGAREIVNDSCGVLVPPGDARALAATLKSLIEQPSLRAELGARGPARARELCEPSAQLRQLHRVFDGVVSGGEKRRV